MRCQIKAESLLLPTMYKSQNVTFPTCSGFCGSGSHMTSDDPRMTSDDPRSTFIKPCSEE